MSILNINEHVFNTFPKSPIPLLSDTVQVSKLLTIGKVDQRTVEWYKMRMSMITASDLASAIGEGHFNKKEDIILKKCGKGPEFKGNVYTEWGVKYENVATRLYEISNKTTIYEFGVLQHPKYLFLGASPDGITPNGIMLEIKCPYSRKITGVVPHHYWIQIQGQLEVCNLTFCDFLECKISEYGNIEEYFNDFEEKREDLFFDDKSIQEKYNNGRILIKTKTGMHKGIVITYKTPTGDNKYYHSELGISREEYDEWYKKIISDIPENYVEHSIIGWKFDFISCVRVKRDTEWFKKTLPKIEETWKLIEHHREVGCEELLKPKRRKITKKEQEETMSVFNDYIEYTNIKETTTNDMTEKKEKQSSNDNWTIEHREAIFDLELSSWLLPKYIPFNCKVINERSVEELKMNLAGMCKIIFRSKNAIIKLQRCPVTQIENSELNIRYIAHKLNNWMSGMEPFIKDLTTDIGFTIPEDLKDSIDSALKSVNKWVSVLYPKWLSKWEN